jgi:hypothetical protein
VTHTRGMAVGSLVIIAVGLAVVQGGTQGTLARVADYNELYINQGFDRCAAPSTGDMATWYSSPHEWEFGFYLAGGSYAGECQSGYTASWIATVLGQGWALIPIWDDLQAPSGCFAPPGIPDQTDNMSSAASTAQNQGEASAVSAINSEVSLGIYPAVVYNDIEGWDTQSTGCNTAVSSFENGFCYQVHHAGSTCGLYSSSSSLTAVLGHSNLPDDVWPADYDHDTHVSAEVGLPVSDWDHNQRIKQFSSDEYGGTVGGVTIYPIDDDCADGVVFNTYGASEQQDSGPCV